MQALIYKPTKSASQSGKAHSNKWLLKYLPSGKYQEKIMGWIGSNKIDDQVILHFETLKDATNYAQKNNISYIIHYPNKAIIKPKSYSDNFIN